MSLRIRSLVFILAIIVAAVFGGRILASSAPAQATDQTAHMADHFSKVGAVQLAVIRGVLEEVREPAKWMVDHQTAEGLPERAARFIPELKKAAQLAADATDLVPAGQATGEMAAVCGRCHAVTAVRPKLDAPPGASVAGTEGHMMEHQHAVTLMYQGLIVPSTDAWVKGADRLRKAALKADKLPSDPALTKEIVALEDKVHDLASQAATTTNHAARSKLYGEVIASCGQCHALHGRVWGPGVPK